MGNTSMMLAWHPHDANDRAMARIYHGFISLGAKEWILGKV